MVYANVSIPGICNMRIASAMTGELLHAKNMLIWCKNIACILPSPRGEGVGGADG